MLALSAERPSDNEPRRENTYWRAVLARDARWDGQFVFAVRSTGVYCRPSCPARRPRRNQVVFFSLPEAAESAKFRPCRRCRPREAPAGNPTVELVRRVCRTIETSLEEPHSLAALSAHIGVSPGHLQRTFKRLLGITPRQYADARRLDRLKARLREGENVTHALYAAGYGASSRLYEKAGAQLGMTPGTYRRGGKGMKISYAIVNSPLGRLLVAATPRGICAVCLGDSDARLRAALSSEYPRAEIRQDASGLARWLKVILNYLKGDTSRLDLPVDVVATAFQRRVWEELRRIPYGTTRSYKQVARAIGRPRAMRAVARACATNPVSLVVPCHRVIREDGGLGGYRWGLERKRALLETESKKRLRRASAAARTTQRATKTR
jgi:AraC family transcriptional regulator of adaptative response/methylated-DNA-[protein]-cysteine methyltransferase